MKTAVIGGGAAGFFAAINLKEMAPDMEVTIYERSHHPLAKVEVSGGGRCNCTNTFEDVTDLRHVYPRGHRLMKHLFHHFDHHDAYRWFESHGVKLTIQPDHCVFPAAQDSHAIIDLFMREARRHHITVATGHRISSLAPLQSYDYIIVTTGGKPSSDFYHWLQALGHTIESPVPSLFSLATTDDKLKSMMGIVCEHATVHLTGTKYQAHGPLLITHWGVSGPAILRLSSFAARHLHEHNYQGSLNVNWTGLPEEEVRRALAETAILHPHKSVMGHPPLGLTQRHWEYLTTKSIGNTPSLRWCEMGKKQSNKLTSTLVNDMLTIKGRAPFRDEFVTCGGVSLKDVNQATLESKACPHLYFAGEVLDIDGVTGGFNFQAAWTTAYTVAHAIAGKSLVKP